MAFTALVLKTPHKADVIRYALQTYQLHADQVLIIGDVLSLEIGAQETGIKKFVVTWGFGEEADLLSYQPDWIAHTIDDIS